MGSDAPGRVSWTGRGYSEAVTQDVLAAVAALALALLGVVGIVMPVLPGSLTVAAALLVWALWGGSPWGWVAFGVGAVLVAVGASASWVLTGRKLRERRIPQWPIVVGLVAGVVGMFVLPVLGFLVGFVVGLLLGEYIRVRNLRAAVETSWAMVKAVGAGILVELTCGLAAVAVLGASVGTHFVFA